MKSLKIKRTMAWVAAAALPVLAALAASAWARGRDAAHAPDESWPALPELRPSCLEDAEHAAHAARTALASSRARMQRYAFAPRDGWLALERAAEAAECARTANAAELTAAASEQLAHVRARVERDARDHFRRYRHLRSHGRLSEAAGDIAFLLALGWPESGTLAERLRRDGAIAGSSAGAAP